MIQEEKQLLIRDLCSRLPYGTICNDIHGDSIVTYIDLEEACVYLPDFDECRSIDDIKPYLRPMSSMTTEELKELNDKYGNIAYFFIQGPPYYHGLQAQHSDVGSIEISEFSEIYDWLNAHHFDYRGLIEKGLALEAPNDMYKTE